MDELLKYFVEHNGDCWQSIFPEAEAHKSRLHNSPDEAFAYMHLDCGVPTDAITVVHFYDPRPPPTKL